MATSKIVKNVLDDMRKTIDELYLKSLVRDCRPASCKETAKDTYEISFSGKDRNVCNIVYDEHISGEEIMEQLLKGYQYTILLYDKSIIQAEFIVKNENYRQITPMNSHFCQSIFCCIGFMMIM